MVTPWHHTRSDKDHCKKSPKPRKQIQVTKTWRRPLPSEIFQIKIHRLGCLFRLLLTNTKLNYDEKDRQYSMGFGHVIHKNQ